MREAGREASKINWAREMRQELMSAGSSLQAAALAVVHAVDEEADTAFD